MVLFIAALRRLVTVTTHEKSREGSPRYFGSSGGDLILMRCEKLIREAEESEMANAMRVNLKRRENGWLLVLEAAIDGKKFVQFRDLSGLEEMPNALQGLLDEPKWRVSKPYVPPSDLTQGV